MNRKRTRSSESESESSDDEYIETELCNFAELERCSKRVKQSFIETQRLVMLDEPDITKILETPLLQQDRVELFQLYEIYKNDDEPTKERMDIRNEISRKFDNAVLKFEQYSKYSKAQHTKFEKDIKELEEYDENTDLKYNILSLQTSIQNKKIIYTQYKRFIRMDQTDDEYPKLKTWIKWAMLLPYDRITTIKHKKKQLTQFLKNVSRQMDEELYGMESVKEQILLFLNTRIINPGMKKASLGLIGPPGTGKTHIARLLAKVSNYPFEQISLGGVKNSDYIKGHQYTYIGSQPGEIVKCMTRMGSKNGILYIDEFEKCSAEVANSILHVTDPAQNHEYTDNFLSQIQIDLSNVWFFYSMNEVPANSALSDRVHCIHLPGYTQLEKFYIVKDFLIRRVHDSMGWSVGDVTFTDQAITYLIETVSPPEDAGIRTLDHAVIKIANKLNFLRHHQNKSGNLQGFNLSFQTDEKLIFPLKVDTDKIELFLK